ncbi:hypothetical protein D9M72_572690 [compost metagenome]
MRLAVRPVAGCALADGAGRASPGSEPVAEHHVFTCRSGLAFSCISAPGAGDPEALRAARPCDALVYGSLE